MSKIIPFFKYHGTGNDFILVDVRDIVFLNNDTEIIANMCSRRFGIGADGLILLSNEIGYDFKMTYFNADGQEGSMCGNGGRCIIAFAKFLKIFDEKCNFLAVDGSHQGFVSNGNVGILMQDLILKPKYNEDYILDTGSPHYVQFVNNAMDVDVVKKGKSIRYSDTFKREGINVNFVSAKGNGIQVATYERGVEDETLSCGTGMVAASIAYFTEKNINGICNLDIETKGGKTTVELQRTGDKFSQIWLIGPAKFVFKGKYKP